MLGLGTMIGGIENKRSVGLEPLSSRFLINRPASALAHSSTKVELPAVLV